MIGTRTLGLLACLLLAGCAGSLETARHDGQSLRRATLEQPNRDRCQQLDDRRSTSAAIAVGGAVLTGASGVSTLPADRLPERYQGPARYAAAGTALVAATVTAIAESVEQSASEAWVREGCGQ